MEKVLWKRVAGKRELLVVTKPFDASMRHQPLEYSDQQRMLGRALSPSVTIYKQSVPAISSITNRVCGVALSLGFGVAAAAACVGEDIPARIHEAQDSIPGFVYVSRFAVAYPLVYHFLSGTRRMVILSCARWCRSACVRLRVVISLRVVTTCLV